MKISGVLLFLFLSINISRAQRNCDLKLEKDNIKIYTCDVVNSKFKAVSASFEIESTLSQLAAMVLDIDHYDAWQYKTLSSRILNRVSEREIVYYTEIAAPVLTDNRDFVIQLTIDQNPHTREMTIEAVSIPGHVLPKDGVIRVSYSKARWIVKPVSNTSIRVDYFIELDLGGMVPPWMVNMVAPQAPYETFKALRAKIGNYKVKGVAFIKD